MIKTKNGNDTLTFEEFAEEVRKIVPVAEEESLRAAYDQISSYYVISHNCAIVPKHEAYTMRYIKEERRHLFKTVLITLSYDCGPNGWCPQDIPSEHLLIDEEDGHVLTYRQICEWVREQRRKAND